MSCLENRNLIKLFGGTINKIQCGGGEIESDLEEKITDVKKTLVSLQELIYKNVPQEKTPPPPSPLTPTKREREDALKVEEIDFLKANINLNTDLGKDNLKKYLDLQTKLKSWIFLKRYFGFLGANATEYKKDLFEINNKMMKVSGSIGITENNINILNLYYEEKEGISEEISKKLNEINNNLLKNMTDSPFEKSMFFILSIFYSQLLEPKFKKKIEKYHKVNKKYIDDDIEVEIKNTNTGYKFINTTFYMISLLNIEKRKEFLKLYEKYDFLIIIHLYAKFILKNMETLSTFELLTDFELDDNISVNSEEHEILENELTVGKIFFLYLNISSKNESGILNCVRKLIYNGSLGTLNIYNYTDQIKNDQVDALKFYNNNSFGGNKKDNFCKNILDKSRFLLKNRVDNLLTAILKIEFEGNLSEERGQKGGNIISETMMIEINKIKINDLFRKFYDEQISGKIKNKTLEEKIKMLRRKGLEEFIYNYGAKEEYTLQHIFNFKNKYILSFLFNLILNHHNTKLISNNGISNNGISNNEEIKIEVKSGSFKKKETDSKICNGNSITMVGHDIHSNVWILYFCTGKELNELEYNKTPATGDGHVKYYNEKGLIHLLFKKITFGNLPDAIPNDIKIINTSNIIIMNDKLLDKKKLKEEKNESYLDTALPVSTTTPTTPKSNYNNSKKVENIYDDSFHKAYAFNQSTNMSYLLLKPKEEDESNTASGLLEKVKYTLYAEPSGKGWSDIKSLEKDFRKKLVLLEDHERPKEDIDDLKNEIEDELKKILKNDLNDDIKIKKLQDLLISLLPLKEEKTGVGYLNLEENKKFKKHNEKGTMERISKTNKGSGFQSTIIEFAKAWVGAYPNFKNSVFEDVHGDNNCFYRAYLNGFLYLLLNKKGKEKIRSIEYELKLKCEGEFALRQERQIEEFALGQERQIEECELTNNLLSSIEEINKWFKKRDSQNLGEIYPGYHNVSLLMIYFLKYIMSYSFKKILLLDDEKYDLLPDYKEDEFAKYWEDRVLRDKPNDTYENYSKYGSHVWGDEPLLPLFRYFGIPTYIINITNMNGSYEWSSIFPDKGNWDSQEVKEEAIFLIKNGGHYKVLYPVYDEIKEQKSSKDDF